MQQESTMEKISSIPIRLQSLVVKLSCDPEVKRNIEGLVTQGRQCVNEFTGMMRREGNAVLTNKQLLAVVKKPEDANVHKLTDSLSEITNALVKQHDTTHLWLTSIHDNIETCRSKRLKLGQDVERKQVEISCNQSQIADFEAEIAKCERDAEEFSTAAERLSSRAYDIERDREEKSSRGWGSVFFGAIVGLVLAPFTLGASFAVVAASGVVAGVNFQSAEECRLAAGRCRNEARTKRRKANSLRDDKSRLSRQVSSLESDVSSIRQTIDKLVNDENAMKATTEFLLKCVSDIHNVQSVFQDMNRAFADAKDHTDFFKIIHEFCSSEPGDIDEEALECLNDLKEKWTEVETVLAHRGARRLAY